VSVLAARYQVDVPHALRVEQTALNLLTQAAPAWGLTEHANILGWAARLHEIGLAVSHNQYQRHGAYLLTNSDIPGFSRLNQQLLTALTLSQRGKFSQVNFQELPTDLIQPARRLAVVLRLAVLLHRSRSQQPLPKVALTATPKTLRIKFPRGWLNKHPLTQADLAQEMKYLKTAKIQMKAS
jgi:exopolyphosphatase/guanosine-5'-triphosphate,3'-diphosphate pyrophosphatase